MRYKIPDLKPGKEYVVQLRTKDGTAVSEWSQKFKFTTITDTIAPKTPTNPTFVISSTAWLASWDTVTQNVNDTPASIANYEIELRKGAVVKNFTENPQDATVQQRSWTHEKIKSLFGNNTTTLDFRVRAVNTNDLKSGWTAWVTANVAAPDPPRNAVVTPVIDGLKISWEPPLNTANVDGYRVYISTTANFTPSVANRIYEGAGLNAFYSTGTYALHYIKIRSYSNFGLESTDLNAQGTPLSPYGPDTQAPDTPVITGATLVRTGTQASAEITWTFDATLAKNTDIQNFAIRWRKTGTTDWAMEFTDKVARKLVIPLPHHATDYEFQIAAVDFVANYSPWSASTTLVGAVPGPPPQVTGVTATSGMDSITLSWTASTAVDVTMYKVELATNSGFSPVFYTTNTGETTITISGLALETTYHYRVSAIDSTGLTGTPSAAASIATKAFPLPPASDGNPPASSPAVTVTPGLGYLHASWPTITNADPVVYEVHLSTTSGFTPASGTKVGETPGTSLTVERTAAGAILTEGTTYYIRIVARDRDGAAAAGTQGSGVAQPNYVDFGSLSDLIDISVKSVVTEYAVNSSETTAPTSGWSTTQPTRTPGTFVWYRIITTYHNAPTNTSSPALLTGNTGATGPQGTPAPYIALTATTQVLSSPSGGGATNPTTAVITGTATNTTITNWDYSLDGGAWSATPPTGVTRSGNSVTVTGSTFTGKTLTVRMANGANGGTAADVITVAKIADGADGTNGTNGTNGVGVSGTAVTYQVGSSGTTAPTGTWTTTVPATSPGQFLWTRTITTYTDSSTSTAYSVAAHGASGSNGRGISSTAVTYQVHSNGTTAPTGTWQSTPPATSPGQFLWTRTVYTYTDSTTDTAYSVAAHGASGKGISSTAVTYQVGSSGTTAPTGTWTSTIPATAPGQFLWTRTITTYTDSTTTTSYSVAAHGADGSDGTDGVGISGTAVTYQVHTSGTTAPTGTWVASPPATTTGQFLWTRTITTYTDATTSTAYSVAAHGTPGADAYTVLLTNEAMVFPGSTNAALAGSETTNVIGYKGTTQQSVTVGTITGQVTGLTTSITNNSTTNPTITVTVATSLTAQTGTLTVPVTIDGRTFSKVISWSVARQGTTGTDGVSVTSITPYYQTTADGAAAPATPNASPPPAPWTTTEPAAAANTDLWRTERTVFSNGTFSYSTVTKVASYEIAVDALNAATLAQQRAASTFMNLNPFFASWTGTYPDGAQAWNTTPTKNTTIYRTAPYGLQQTVTNASSLNGVAIHGMVAPIPESEYVTFEADIYLISGNFSGAGFVLDWSGYTNIPRAQVKYGELIPNPVVGKWYRVTQTIKRNAATGGAFTAYTAYLMANYSPLGTQTVKDMVTDRIGLRPATNAEIEAFNASSNLTTTVTQLEAELKDYMHSRGADLVTNGTGLLGDDTNFTPFTFTKLDMPVGAAGAFDSGATEGAAQGAVGTYLTDEYLPVDPSKRFRMSYQIKQKGASTAGRHYGLLWPHDAYKLAINPYNYMFTPGTTTTLAVALNPGDTTITLTSSANWYGQTGKNAGANTHWRSIIWWDYVDPGGKEWPAETYSRNYSGADYWADGGITGNVITLRAPYSGPARPAGTQLSNGSSGGSFMYVTGAVNTIVPQTWTTHAASIIGIVQQTIAAGGTPAQFGQAPNAGWPPGVAYARLGWLLNRTSAGAQEVNSNMSVALVSFSEAGGAQEIADAALLSASGKNKVTHSTSAPGSTSNNAGDTWFQYDVSNQIMAQFRGNGGTSWTQQTLRHETIASVDAAKITVGTLDVANRISAGSIHASKLLIGDTSNMSEISESIAGSVAFGTWTSTVASGWAGRSNNSNEYIMFRNQKGPVPFKTGDRIRVTFEAYASQTITGASVRSWLYGNVATSDVLGTVNITTTPTTYTVEGVVAADTTLKTAYIIGVYHTGLVGADIFVRNVRAYVMNAGELIVDGSIKGNHVAAATMSTDKLTIGDFTNLFDDPTLTGAGWTFTTRGSIINHATMGKTILLTAPGQVVAYNKNRFEARTGDKFFISATTWADAAASMGLLLYDEAGAYVASVTTGIAATSTWTTTSAELTVPAGATIRTAIPFIQIPSTATTGVVYVTNGMTIRRKVNGELIIDGEIKFAHLGSTIISGNYIKTDLINTGAIIIGQSQVTGLDTALAGKASTFVTTVASPTSPTAVAAGDLWLDQYNKKIYRASAAGTASWVLMQDLNTKSQTFTTNVASPTNPTAVAAGDIWLDQYNNRIYRATAAGTGSWVLINDIPATATTVTRNLWGFPTDTTLIDGGKIYTNSIKATSVAVADFTNFAYDPYGANSSSWTKTGTATHSFATFAAPYLTPSGRTTAIRITANGTSTYLESDKIPVFAGDKFYTTGKIRFWGGTPTTGSLHIGVAYYNSSGTWLATHTASVNAVGMGNATQWSTVTLNESLVPAGADYMRPIVWSSSVDAGAFDFSDIVIRRKNGGELIVDGSIAANKITAGTYTGGEFIIGSGGILKTAGGEVKITHNGIEVTAAATGGISANKITTGSFLAGEELTILGNMTITTGGLFRSANYVSSGGTQGFLLTSTGLNIVDGTINAKTLKGGTISGTTITIGIGGSLVVDSTAVIRSNNYSTTAGWQISASGIVMNDTNSKILAGAVVGDTITGRALTVTSGGYIQSSGFTAPTSTSAADGIGWKIDQTGLYMYQGTIQGATIRTNQIYSLSEVTVDSVTRKTFSINASGYAEFTGARIYGNTVLGSAGTTSHYIQSYNYSPASVGWKIDAAGGAQFNNLSVYGGGIYGATLSTGLNPSSTARRVVIDNDEITFYTGQTPESTYLPAAIKSVISGVARLEINAPRVNSQSASAVSRLWLSDNQAILAGGLGNINISASDITVSTNNGGTPRDVIWANADFVRFNIVGGLLEINGGSNVSGRLSMNTGSGSAVTFRPTWVAATQEGMNASTPSASNTVDFYCKDITRNLNNAYSDARLKRDIFAIEKSWAYEKIKDVSIKQFKYNHDTLGRVNYGIIAQELEQTLPELVGKTDDGTRTANYEQLSAVNVAATQMLMEKVEQLQAELEALKQQLNG